MDKDKIIEELEFENKKLRCENEYIKKNLQAFLNRSMVTEAEAQSRVVRFVLKVRRRLIRLKRG
ncbi:MAG: hypothetical protein E7660_06535 [Ruminococcaceae bacterium]|nr:hypothetical protein [Oscillospiraceae bacterium]